MVYSRIILELMSLYGFVWCWWVVMQHISLNDYSNDKQCKPTIFFGFWYIFHFQKIHLWFLRKFGLATWIVSFQITQHMTFPKVDTCVLFFLEFSFKIILLFITIWVILKTNVFDKNETFISRSMKASTRDGTQTPRARTCWYDTYEQYVRNSEQDSINKISTCSLLFTWRLNRITYVIQKMKE